MRHFRNGSNWWEWGLWLSVLSATIVFLLAASCMAQEAPPAHKTRNVVIVMLDGLRWKEVFAGADRKLMDKHGPRLLGDSRKRTSQARELYWRPTAAERREALMPFMWSVVAKNGQIFGNRKLGSKSEVSNQLKFSYPGYNETLTGAPDDRRILSNKNIPNPNVTVLEWLNAKPEFADRVAAFGAWQVFEGIFNAKECGFLVNAGYQPLQDAQESPELALLNRLKKSAPRIWTEEPFDSLPFYTALAYMKAHKPRVVFIGLGETDDWGHMGAYPEYLNAAHRDDEYLRELWEQLQSMPEYRDQTTLVVLSDHGRGSGLFWKVHGWPVLSSGQTWMAFMGPDTLPLGEREMSDLVTESQIAATVAALLGEDFNAASAEAGKPIEDVLSHSSVLAFNSRTAEKGLLKPEKATEEPSDPLLYANQHQTAPLPGGKL